MPKIWLTYIKLARATKKLARANFLQVSQIWGTTSNISSGFVTKLLDRRTAVKTRKTVMEIYRYHVLRSCCVDASSIDKLKVNVVLTGRALQVQPYRLYRHAIYS